MALVDRHARSRRLISWARCLVPLALLAAALVIDAAPAAASTASLSGVVTNDSTSGPVAGAQVRACGRTGCTTATTAANGSYAMFVFFNSLSDGPVSVGVTPPTGLDLFYQSRYVPLATTMVANFSLHLGGRIALTATDPAGQPTTARFGLCNFFVDGSSGCGLLSDDPQSAVSILLEPTVFLNPASYLGGYVMLAYVGSPGTELEFAL